MIDSGRLGSDPVHLLKSCNLPLFYCICCLYQLYFILFYFSLCFVVVRVMFFQEGWRSGSDFAVSSQLSLHTEFGVGELAHIDLAVVALSTQTH